MTRALAAAMEGRVVILLLLLVWQNIFLHLGKFSDLCREENDQYAYGYFITCLTLSVVRLTRCIICFSFLMNAMQYFIWYMLLCIDDRLVCRFG